MGEKIHSSRKSCISLKTDLMKSGRISFLHMPKPCTQGTHCLHRAIYWVLEPCHTFPSIWHAWLLLVRLDCLKDQRLGRLALTFCILMAPMAGHTDPKWLHRNKSWPRGKKQARTELQVLWKARDNRMKWKSTLESESREQPEAEIALGRGRTTAKDRRPEKGSNPAHPGTQFTSQSHMPRLPAHPV